MAIAFTASCSSRSSVEQQEGETKAASVQGVRSASQPQSETSPKPELPPWIEIRVSRVRVAKSDATWDGPRQEMGIKGVCRSLTQLAGLAGRPDVAVAGEMGCGLFGDSQRQTDPTLPDLQLLLRGSDTTYLSYIAWDQTSHTFDYAFAIPRGAVPEGGVVIAVVDADDGSVTGQEIGSHRLSKDDLISAVTSKAMLSLTPSGLELLELTVGPHDGAFKKKIVEVDTSKGGTQVQAFPIRAGDVVRIEAEGSWTIGRFFDNSAMGPAGVPGGGTKDGNLALFPEPANGAAVAAVGINGRVKPVAVNPCVKFVAPFGGVVWVGVNDRKYSDNKGIARFTVMKRGPTAAQWASPGTLLECN